MKPRALRALRVVSVVATVSVSGCCLDDGSWKADQFALSEIDSPAFAAEVARCRADAADCEAACLVHWMNYSDYNLEANPEIRGCVRDGDALSYEGFALCAPD